MRALVLVAPSTFEYVSVPDPQPSRGEVLVRVQACGICGSDVHGMDGSTGRRQPPIIMGHEAAGTIAAVGDHVETWRIGDSVTFDSTVYCGDCVYCRSGRVNLCDTRRVLGVSCGDYRRDGAFAEYVAVPQHILYRVPASLAPEHAAMVEPVSVAVHAVRRSNPAPESTALVIGAGMIGLLTIQVLRARSVQRIIAADIDAERLAMARECGADVTLDAASDIALAVQSATDGSGADVVFEAVGVAPTVTAAIASARKGATVVLIGNVTPQVVVPLQAVVTRELSLFGSCASAGEYPNCLELLASGKVDVAPLISACAPLEEGATWFKRLYAREPGLMKVILRP